MPVYQCLSPEGAISPGLCAELAKELTRIHCEVTGAAPDFVQVIFVALPEGTAFLNGRTSPMTNIAGYIRAGRPREIREQLFNRINAAWTRLTGFPPALLKITLFDVPANWIMQDGVMMPDIGQDQEWRAQRKATLE
jgi:phenylpyruvate tautomerase PptA (4-oxalocrotonate tautomerase family)